MIIEFSVQNFRSIYDKVTLSMLASKLSSKEATLDNVFYHPNYPNLPLLKSAVIYGANASGKSNVWRSLIHFVKPFILFSTDNKLGTKLDYDPFRLLPQAIQEPMCFEMDFVAKDNVRYIYGFKANKEDIEEEYLSAFTSRKETKLFVRKKGEKIQFSSLFKGEKKILEEQLLKNNLLLSKAANSNYKQMQVIYEYFSESMNFVWHDEENYSEYSESMERAFYDEKFKKKITDLLQAADTGIEGISIKKKAVRHLINLDPDDATVYETEVIHNILSNSKPDTIQWNIGEESTGTQRILALSERIIDAIDIGGVLIVDEINNSLHPHLSRFIIELFNNKKTNPKNAQLIFTTHDVSLLTSELFRRDQVWFTEKNNKGMTELYSLGSFDKKDVRKDIPFDKWYLSGRFGAVPILQEFKMDKE